MNNIQRLISLFALVLLTSCTTIQTTSIPQSEKERQQKWQKIQLQNSEITRWALKGKIGVKTGKKGGSATLRWYHLPGQQDIELYGPFGGGRVKIKTTHESARLRDTKGKVIEGKTAKEVLYKRLGWHVPFDELIMWSRGLPNEDAKKIEIDHLGRLKSLQQGIWQVEYQEYRNIENLTLPRKLIITSLPGKIEIYDDDGNYLGDELNVKIIIKDWWEIH